MKTAAHVAPACPHVLILGAGFSTDNRGVAALACGTIASVIHSLPRAKISLLDYAKKTAVHYFHFRERSHEIETVALRFSKNIFQRNHIVRLLFIAGLLRYLPAGLRAHFIRRNHWLHRIDEADIVGALSGGDSFSSLYGLRRLLYVSLPQILVLTLRKPLVLLPQSYGPFETRTAKIVARYVLSRATQVFSRDADGLAIVQRLAPKARAVFAYDMGFALEPQAIPRPLREALLKFRPDGPVIGLNISGLLHAAGAEAKNKFGLHDDYADAMREVVIFLVEWKKCTVILVPHVFGHNGESDVTAATLLWKKLPAHTAKRVLLCSHELDQHQVKGLIGQCDLFAGARMHACIAALSQLVPAVALAYSDKFIGVLSSVGMADLVVDLRQATRTHIMAALAQALEKRMQIRERLTARIPAVHHEVLCLFRQFSQDNAKQRTA